MAFSEIKEVKNYKYDSYDAIQYTQEILFLIADHEIKNGNFNHATQVLDYLFIGIPSDDLNKEGFISFMKTCTNYLISQSKYKEALSLINYYQFLTMKLLSNIMKIVTITIIKTYDY